MAVSLSQYSQATQSRPRSSTTQSTTPAPYNPSDFLAVPTPEQSPTLAAPIPPRPNRHSFATLPSEWHVPALPRPNRHSYTSAPTQWQQPPQFQPAQKDQQSPYKLIHSPIYRPSPIDASLKATFKPTPPSKHLPPIQTPPTPPASSPSTAGVTTPSSWHASIEPDPLPPHSNPQALTKTQSEAFAESRPIAPVHITLDEVRTSWSGLPDFRIVRKVHRASIWRSGKHFVKVIKMSTGATVGTIRVTSNTIDLTIYGLETSLAQEGIIRSRWVFESTTSMTGGTKWFWKKDRSTGGAMLEDAKRHGNVLARMKGDLLTFEKGRLSTKSYDEIVVSAVAMVEAARRQKRRGDIVDIASAVGDFAESSGGNSGVDGGAGGGGGI